MKTIADLDRVIELVDGIATNWTILPRSDAHEALTLLRSMRENARLGTAWKDGDFFCNLTDGRCEDSASWLFSPVCEHDPEPEVIEDLRRPQFAALLILTPEEE